MGFAENLKNIRTSRNISQQELAKKLNVAQSTVGMWESGKRVPKLDELKRLARVLGITISCLLSGKERKIEIIKNEIYIDGEKVSELDPTDVDGIIEYINLVKSKKGKIPKGPPPAMGSHAKKILVIDDEQEICEMLYSFLVPHNYKVFLAFNGQMGLEYFEEVKPDIVLLDLKMPDIDGVEVLKIIRKVSDVPVVVITGHPQDVADIHVNDLTIEGYLEKPISLKETLNTLKHIIGE
ncbi:MAG: response regulator [Candidatus Omnitrophica bacterium]|nr:response regulator [Candidatus Omnitrophota bacterium]MCM8791019.1 response regulator [Candidatus Omnitrophota bacterium]